MTSDPVRTSADTHTGDRFRDQYGRPTLYAARVAVERIQVRRAELGDVNVPDDLHEAARHVFTHTRLEPRRPYGIEPVAWVKEKARRRRDALREDFADAWLIMDWLDVARDRERLSLLRMVRSPDAGAASFAELADAIGVRSRSSAESLVRRYEAAAQGLPKQPRALYAARAQQQSQTARARGQATPLVDVVRALLTARSGNLPAQVSDDIRHALDNLTAQLDHVDAGRPVPPSMPIVLTMLLDDLDDEHPGWHAPALTAMVTHARELTRKGNAA
jgi:hypothetical protein